MADKPLDWFPKHEPVNVSEAMKEASEPPADRVTKPSNDHQVSRIAKRESVPADE